MVPKCDHTFMLKDMHRMPRSTAGDSVRQTRIDAAAAYRLLCRPLKFGKLPCPLSWTDIN